jgi:hypothetical protein
MKLRDIAHARTGDKGDTSTISLIARAPGHYQTLLRIATVERVAAQFVAFAPQEVVRYELPGIEAVNFVLRGVLRGGVTRSVALDAHGKSLAFLLLDLEIGEPT